MATHPIKMTREKLTIGVTGRSPEVKWGHNPFFANKSRQDGDREVQMVPNDLTRRAASENVHIDLFGSWSDFEPTCPKVKFWNWPFNVKKYMCRTGSTRRTRWCHFHFRISHIKKLFMKNHLRENDNFFVWWPLEPKLLTLVIYDLKSYWGMKRASKCFFRILPSYHTFGDNSDCLRKIVIFSKKWPLVTSGDLKFVCSEMTLAKVEISSLSILRHLPLVAKYR